MIIKDSKGKYTIEVDKVRRIVKETPVGLWKNEDIERLQNDYVSKIMPELGATKPWAILNDLRGYKTSDVVEELRKHTQWKKENGLEKVVMIVDSAINKMQMKRTGGTVMQPIVFSSEKEGNDWLREQGF